MSLKIRNIKKQFAKFKHCLSKTIDKNKQTRQEIEIKIKTIIAEYQNDKKFFSLIDPCILHHSLKKYIQTFDKTIV